MSASLPDEQAAEASAASPQTLALQLGWAAIVAGAGGFLCALVIDWVGEVGAISLWGLGAFAGVVGWKIAGRRNTAAAWSLAAATIVAFLLAEVLWIQWNIKQGQGDFLTSIKLLPLFLKEYKVAAFVGGIMTGFGAYSAYRQNA